MKEFKFKGPDKSGLEHSESPAKSSSHDERPSPCVEKGIFNSELSRRDFIKTSAFVGGTALLSTQLPLAMARVGDITDGGLQSGEFVEYPLNKPENILHSVCLNCHVKCLIKVKLFEGIAVKIDGNPFAAVNNLPNLPYDTSLSDAANVDGKICPKGQAGIQIAYDPYRIRRVLKRDGKRGENKWRSLDFNQAIDEIVNGANFPDGTSTPGLQDIFVLRDSALSKLLADDAKAVAKGDMSLSAFKAKHADHLDMLIDPDHPDLGPKNNQFVFQAGRIQHGRKELGKRWTKDGFGSINFFEHTTICEQSHHIATQQMTSGKKTHLKPDYLNAEFVIHWGTGAFEANFGSTAITQLVTDGMTQGNLRQAVIDPRLSKTAAKADLWVPVRPGGDMALAMAMARWIIENDRHDKTFLGNPNKLAAENDGEKSWTDASFLVRQDNGKFLRVADIASLGVQPAPPVEIPASEIAHPPHPAEDFGIPDFSLENTDYVVMTSSGPQAAGNADHGLLEWEGDLAGISVKTVFSLYKARVMEKTLDEYVERSGVSLRQITRLADEFTSHGKKAAIDTYRGPVQHTDGYYAQQAALSLCWLIGNMDWKGGLGADGGHWHEFGDKGGPFPPEVTLNAPGGLKAFGPPLTREKVKYEDSTLFTRDGYPAKRPWYPFTGNVYQEVIPSAEDGYPYSIKALLIHMGTPALASPAGQDNIRVLLDHDKVPLLLACDVVIGETSMYADYIIPDLSYLERWGTPHTVPQPVVGYSPFRQPTIAPLTEVVNVDGEDMPISLEAFMIAVGKQLGMPGIGPGGFGDHGNFDRPEDYFIRLGANIAYGDKSDGSDGVPEASEEEMLVFQQAHAHLPPSVYDERKWKEALGSDEKLWRQLVYMLNRGGRFKTFDQAYSGDYIKSAIARQLFFYVEPVGQAKHSLTGQNFDPLPHLEPVLDAAGKPVEDDPNEFPFQLITHKEITGGHSRTPGQYWGQISILPENPVLINSVDARKHGFRTGDIVRLVSASSTGIIDLGNNQQDEVEGKVKVIEGIRPGVVAVSWHYGHWAYGSRSVEVDGQMIKGDKRRGTGLCPNPAMRLDPALGNVCLTDPIGGSASFFDTRVRLEKVS